MKTSSIFTKSIISLVFVGLFALSSSWAHAACGQLQKTSTLRRGSIGSAVEILQTLANTYFKENLQVDGNFGSGTRSAIIRIQNALGLSADGVVGKNTFSALEEYCANEPQSPSTSFTHEVKKFTNFSEFKAFIEKNTSEKKVYARSGGDIQFAAVSLESDDVATDSAAPAAKSSDFSETNIQEIGVDESDIVKTDGEYIYAVTNNEVVVVDAQDPADLKVIARVAYEGTPQELYLHGSTLIVLGRDYEKLQQKKVVGDVSTRIWYPQQTAYTSVSFFDISNVEKPELEKNYQMEGNYVDSRITDGELYVINEKYMYDTVLPYLREDGRSQILPLEITYFDMPYTDTRLTQIHGINVKNPDDIDSSQYLLSGNQNIYVSQDSIYISYQDYFRGGPVLFNDAIEIDVAEDELIAVPEPRIVEPKEETIIHRIEIDKGESELLASGTVPGRILNQFSLSEYKNHLRIATTDGNNWNGGQSKNNMYVLDMDLDIVGSVTGLAPGERIYSARFMGDKGYMVTFEQVDPLYVIDLSNPRSPRVEGELKIPGFSNYLHPYDNETLLGIGRDVTIEENGRVTTRGVKVALFDVSNVNNPREIDSYIIGDRGSNSDALYDHKAVLFSKEKNLLVIPFSEYYYGDDVRENFNGAAVFNVDKTSGIKLQGKVTQSDNQEQRDWQKQIHRTLYIDDVLFSLSNQFMQSNNLSDLVTLDQIQLSQNKNVYDQYPTPIPFAI